MAFIAKESDIQKSILHYLRINQYICKRNNAGKFFASYGGQKRCIDLGESGWPDIIGLTKEGKFFGIEVKTKVGILSETQKEVGARILASSGIWFVARDLSDVISHGF